MFKTAVIAESARLMKEKRERTRVIAEEALTKLNEVLQRDESAPSEPTDEEPMDLVLTDDDPRSHPDHPFFLLVQEEARRHTQQDPAIRKILGMCAELRRALAEFTQAELPMLVDVFHDPTLLRRSVHDLNLSVRSRKRLERGHIETFGQLVALSADDLLRGPTRHKKTEAPHFGITGLNEIRGELAAFGLKLRDD